MEMHKLATIYLHLSVSAPSNILRALTVQNTPQGRVSLRVICVSLVVTGALEKETLRLSTCFLEGT